MRVWLRSLLALAIIGIQQPITSSAFVGPRNFVIPGNPNSESAAQTITICRKPAGAASIIMSTAGSYRVRACCGGQDYAQVIGSVDRWWGGRHVSPMLPRLFFENFCDTSFVAVLNEEGDGPTKTSSAPEPGREEKVVGFLCGFTSQSRAGEVS